MNYYKKEIEISSPSTCAVMDWILSENSPTLDCTHFVDSRRYGTIIVSTCDRPILRKEEEWFEYSGMFRLNISSLEWYFKINDVYYYASAHF